MVNFGIRVEVTSKIPKIKTILSSFQYAEIAVSNLNDNHRIFPLKQNELIVVKAEYKPNYNGLLNFSLFKKLDITEDELQRLVKIVNVLGNGKLIREKVRNLAFGFSTFNKLSEFDGFPAALKEMNRLLPNFINSAWYYAPEIKIE